MDRIHPAWSGAGAIDGIGEQEGRRNFTTKGTKHTKAEDSKGRIRAPRRARDSPYPACCFRERQRVEQRSHAEVAEDAEGETGGVACQRSAKVLEVAEMSGCVLRVEGKDFDAKAFVAANDFKVIRLKDSSFNVDVSRREADDLPGQIQDALRFLESHADVLKALRSVRGVEMVLDFGIAQKDVAAQFVRLPSELVRRAAEIGAGLEVSLYAVQDP